MNTEIKYMRLREAVLGTFNESLITAIRYEAVGNEFLGEILPRWTTIKALSGDVP